MTLRVGTPEEVRQFYGLIESRNLDPEAYLLPYFRGSLYRCADESLVLLDEQEEPVACAIVTMNFVNDNLPYVLGTYTLPSQRGRGYGTAILKAAIERLIERGANQIVIELKTAEGKRTFQKMPPDLQAICVTRDVEEES